MTQNPKRSVKKTLSVPKWLNDLAEEKNLPFSNILQEALKKKLGVYSYEEYLKLQAGKALPDKVGVVRCKDCIHWWCGEPTGACLKIYTDGNVSKDAWQERRPDDYCSYGKPIRRGEDDTDREDSAPPA